MTNEDKKKFSFLVDNEEATGDADNNHGGKCTWLEKIKKPAIYTLMAVACLGCFYLIFSPAKDKKNANQTGLNKAVPQAANSIFPDKQKAYEEELLEQKQAEQRSALLSLSEYWNSDSAAALANIPQDSVIATNPGKKENASISSYRNAQQALGSFYEDNTNYEAKELRRQLDEANKKLEEQHAPAGMTVQDQLALMEKSYEMAARFMPAGYSKPGEGDSVNTQEDQHKQHRGVGQQESRVVPILAGRKTSATSLRRELLDSDFVARFNQNANLGFFTVDKTQESFESRNTVRATIQRTQILTGEGTVYLCLAEAVKTPMGTLPSGATISAQSKFQNGRLHLKVTSLELCGSIVPVELIAYDLDGQQGLFVPFSAEMNAVTEIAGNMSQNSGTSIMMPRSAGQQLAGDLTRGVVQGVSGYVAKKIKSPKITLKSGVQVLLVSKKKSQ